MISLSEQHFSNAEDSMVLTLFGKVTFVTEELLNKNIPDTTVTPDLNSTSDRESQFDKASKLKLSISALTMSLVTPQ